MGRAGPNRPRGLYMSGTNNPGEKREDRRWRFWIFLLAMIVTAAWAAEKIGPGAIPRLKSEAGRFPVTDRSSMPRDLGGGAPSRESASAALKPPRDRKNAPERFSRHGPYTHADHGAMPETNDESAAMAQIGHNEHHRTPLEQSAPQGHGEESEPQHLDHGSADEELALSAASPPTRQNHRHGQEKENYSPRRPHPTAAHDLGSVGHAHKTTRGETENYSGHGDSHTNIPNAPDAAQTGHAADHLHGAMALENGSAQNHAGHPGGDSDGDKDASRSLAAALAHESRHQPLSGGLGHSRGGSGGSPAAGGVHEDHGVSAGDNSEESHGGHSSPSHGSPDHPRRGHEAPAHGDSGHAGDHGISIECSIAMDRYQRSMGSGADFSAGMAGIRACLAEIRLAASMLKSTTAQVVLGAIFHRGDHLPQDCEQSVRWFRKAAEQGSVAAFFLLGSMYDQGHEIPKDPVEAYAWYLLAMEKRHARAHEAMTKLEPSLTPQQLQEAKKRAEQYRPTPGHGREETKPPEHPPGHPGPPGDHEPSPPKPPHDHPGSPGERNPAPPEHRHDDKGMGM